MSRFTFRMEDHYLCVVRGDTLSFGLEFEGLSQDLSSATFNVKKNYADTATTFSLALGGGITKKSDGKYVVRVPPSYTANLEAGKFFYDLTITVNGDVFTILRGVFEILPNV